MCFSKSFIYGLIAMYGLCIYACNSSEEYLSEKDLHQYIFNSNKFSKSVDTDKLDIKVIYKPTDLLVAQEIRSKENPTEKEVLEARAKYSTHFYFVVSFSKGSKDALSASSMEISDFSGLLQTISFRMSEIITLTTSGHDTIPVADYVYNRTFGLSNSTDLLFVFDKSKAQGQDWIEMNIEEFGFGAGKQTVRFKVSDLENAPRIYKL